MAISANLKRALRLLADGGFHSGTELAESLGVSRSAICKQLHGLSELGIELSAVSGKGYKLQHPMALLSLRQIEQYLSPQADLLLNGVEIHDLIASTNSYLLEKAQQSGANGIACFAEFQSAGKGRRGRQWLSPFGSNIYLSVLWRYQSSPAMIAGLSLAVGVAVVRALNELGIVDVGLKWPNDIYWRQRKLAGILIEVSGESGGPCNAVIGLGLNCYLPPQQAQAIEQAWVDLDSIVGRHSHGLRNKLAAVLLNHIMPVVADFDDKGLSHYLAEWRDYDCMQGRAVDIYMGQQCYQGKVEGIDDQGMLMIRDQDLKLTRFASGEVSFSNS
ncbi:bifunctional biotin--[acetyl-CoA-carboxylase] ligase/biotin operon repressor BirA [Methylomarinum sp. Ch1-1]|uniref:Bifunctional ligase/repressor BirA n=1 Tax=Methylomarinum roseum TaxID=3067653 RepID=A0AAU7NRD4_9GAMM|nr:bifunctional biotin--[acetyl-CoA-carboxylase] ligase/biotin operon repressor BirA [Methylomarinum sp. Ch1-1]MDP4520497.1 bifunctional biotin--[acetyl-CoA-carboxylase] ligase/biotin operon repressor BirA [Methylomarinum sp. Ch1-1]